MVVFETSRIFGSDSRFYYTGEHEVSGEEVTATVVSTYLSGDDMTAFCFRTRGSVHVGVKSRRLGDKVVGEAWLLDQPSARVKMVQERLTDLP